MKILKLLAAIFLIGSLGMPAVADESVETTKYLTCATPAQLWPALDRVDENDPFQLLQLDTSLLTDGCLYSSLSEYPQRQVEVNWMYYRKPLLFDVAKVTVVKEDGQLATFWMATRVIHTADMADSGMAEKPPQFVLRPGPLVTVPEGAKGKFIRRFVAVMNHRPFNTGS
tara:strand:+ start:841 stop:1350 length:510 start_codon:yes stop_codon:yes gene_type:complete